MTGVLARTRAGAAIMRLRRERATITGDLVYLAMAAFVAWGRFGQGSFTRLTQPGAQESAGDQR